MTNFKKLLAAMAVWHCRIRAGAMWLCTQEMLAPARKCESGTAECV